VTPVLDEADLRVGDVVILRPCKLCGGEHRARLLMRLHAPSHYRSRWTWVTEGDRCDGRVHVFGVACGQGRVSRVVATSAPPCA
jgi:hypothetical protein